MAKILGRIGHPSAIALSLLLVSGCAKDSGSVGTSGATGLAGLAGEAQSDDGGTPSAVLGGAGSGGTGRGGAGTGVGGASRGGSGAGGSGTGGTGIGGSGTGGATSGGSGAGGSGVAGSIWGGTSSGGLGSGGAEAGQTSAGAAVTAGASTGGAEAIGGGAGMASAGEPSVAGSAGAPLPGLHWNFDRLQEGRFIELSGQGPDLVVENATSGEGLLDNGLALSGSGSVAQSSEPVVDTLGSYSVAAWVRLDELGSFHTFVSQDGQSISAFYLQTRDDQSFAFTTFPSDDPGASACVASGTMRPRLGEWYHLVGTRDGVTGEQRLYRDGILVGKASCPGGFASSGPLVVGHGRWDGVAADFLNGRIDELRIVDRALSASEIVDLYEHDRPDAKNYLFAYFAEQAQGRGDGLRLAHSHDGLHWGAIGANRVFMPPQVGGGSFRDPHLLRAPDGNYHLVWTTSCVPWAESGCVQDRGFGHAKSPDLVTWGDQDYIEIDLPVEHVWAPETFYDLESQQFLVFWSSPVDNDPNASDPHRIYYVLTEDFEAFTEPSVLYGKDGRNFIDATIYQEDDGYVLFLKDEADGQKNIRAVTSQQLFGAAAWTGETSSPLTGNYGAEGPSVLERDGQLFLYFDKYGEGAYGALRSTDLTNLASPSAWEDISSQVFFQGVRHGTPIEVPFEIFRAVAQKAGEAP